MTEFNRCCSEDFGGSHYHCAGCGKVSGMQGHTDRHGNFTCQVHATHGRGTAEDIVAFRKSIQKSIQDVTCIECDHPVEFHVFDHEGDSVCKVDNCDCGDRMGR